MPPISRIEQVPPFEWERWVVENDAIVLDVREPLEWVRGVLPGSTKIALSFLPDALDQLDRETPILVVCRAGNRSLLAAKFLESNGFAKAANLTGGLTQLGLA
jgi:rhodanese-related sulfurtransferase